MEELPKINEAQIAKLETEMRQRIVQGTMTNWLDEQLKALANTNPILYKYVMEHSQKFAVGSMMVQDVQSIAVSITLEYILLLSIIGMSFTNSKELKNFTDFWGKFFPKGLGNE